MIYKKAQFDIPENLIYLDGNSLGPLPKAVSAKITQTVESEWGTQLIRGWNDCGWMQQPRQLGDRIANIVGAQAGTIVLGDTLSIKVYQAVSAALTMNPQRRVILSDTGNFPTDLYMVQGLINSLDHGYELKTVAPQDVAGAIDEQVAVVMLTQVDYRTGRIHDMQRITELTHKAGAISVWDLAHSAGAIPVELTHSACDFAVGCTYKYLNAGPGAPAFIYVRPDLIETITPALSGWLGHQAPFAFEPNYTPAPSIDRMRVGTPSVLQMAALSCALDLFDDVDMQALRQVSVQLTELFIEQVEARCPELSLASPRDAQDRGSQVSFGFEHGYAVVQALIDQGVIGDFRAPNIMRFGFTPLYISTDDVIRAVDVLESILKDKIWKDPKYQTVKAVT